MYEMERTKHGRGLTLAMGLAKMHLCVLCWDLMKDYMLELMISMCVFCWDLMKDYVLEFIIACVYSAGLLWQSMCWNWLLHVCVYFHAKIMWLCWNLMSNCIVCSEFVNRCWNWVVCSKLVFPTELCVLQRIWGSLPKLYCMQQICNSLSKLSCL
jgi:hypothetical protein